MSAAKRSRTAIPLIENSVPLLRSYLQRVVRRREKLPTYTNATVSALGLHSLFHLHKILNRDTDKQIQNQFVSEWVLLEDPETTEANEIISGTVLWHSKDRDEVYRKARELRPRRFALLYTGSMPSDTAIIL